MFFDVLNYKLSKFISRLIWNVPGKKYIIFESNPDFADNSGAAFKRAFEEQKWNRRFRFAWIVGNADRQLENVMCVGRHARGFSHIFRVFVIMRAAAIIDCNRQIMKRNPNTLHIYLSHGSPIKSVHDFYYLNDDTDYMLSQSEYWKAINSYEFRIPENRMVICGFPRNDDLFDQSIEVKDLFSGYKFQKTVIWYPTYRQYKADAEQQNVSAIPVLYDGQTAEKLNVLAQRYGVILVVKPHPAQNLDYIKKLDLSNIVFIDDAFFDSHGLRAYQFLAATDAMITDYSSVFFDYLLTGKPIGLTFEDYDTYKENPGFAIDPSLITSCSYMLDQVDDFERFFQVIVSGVDSMKEKRDEVKRLTNQYQDANSSQRVLDFIEEKLRERNLWPDK